MAEILESGPYQGSTSSTGSAQAGFVDGCKAMLERVRAYWRHAEEMREIDRLTERERLDAGLPPKRAVHWSELLALIVVAQAFMIR